MNIGFYHAGRGDERDTRSRIALLMQSIRHWMPDVKVTQFTDLTTQPVKGTDAIVRRGVLPLALACIDAYASVEGEWLFLDTDVLIQDDVTRIFRQSFDIAVSDRRGTFRAQDLGSKALAAMPYNKGAVFSRCQAFWKLALATIESYAERRQGWMGDQVAMCEVIASGRFKVQILPSRYNYPPHRHDEDVSDKAIIHLKGKERKFWMQDFAKIQVAA